MRHVNKAIELGRARVDSGQAWTASGRFAKRAARMSGLGGSAHRRVLHVLCTAAMARNDMVRQNAENGTDLPVLGVTKSRPGGKLRQKS